MALKKKVFVQVEASQYDIEKITKDAEADFAANNKGTALKDIKLYVKPEDGKAYYVANAGKISGNVNL